MFFVIIITILYNSYFIFIHFISKNLINKFILQKNLQNKITANALYKKKKKIFQKYKGCIFFKLLSGMQDLITIKTDFFQSNSEHAYLIIFNKINKKTIGGSL